MVIQIAVCCTTNSNLFNTKTHTNEENIFYGTITTDGIYRCASTARPTLYTIYV